jgi:hypothetical protein
MSTFKKAVSIALVVAFAATIAPAAKAAQSTADLNAQIAALMAQINSLQSQLNTGSSATVSSATFTRDLTVGAKGEDVKALQGVLISKGYLKIAAPTGYFGPATKAALAAWQKDAGISPAVGYFGPKTRATFAASTGGTTTGGTTGGTTVPTGAGVTVSLATDNPMSQSVLGGVSSISPVLSLNFTAGASPVTVTGLKINRTGLSADQDINNVYLMDGAKVVANNLGIANSVVNFSASNGLFTVPAGTTKNIKVAASFVGGSNQVGKTFTFSVASADAVTTQAGSVSGAFPITGNLFSVANVTNQASLQITNSLTATLSVSAGQNGFNVGQFTMQAQNQAVSVKSIKVTNTGSIQNTDLANIKLQNGATVLATLPGLSSDGTAVFDLSANPLQLTSGQTAVLYVYADIVGGVNRNFTLSIQNNYDIVAQDMMYNVGVLPTLTSGSFPMSMATVNVQYGSLIVTKDTTSPVNYVLPGGSNQTLAKVAFKASGEAVRITSLSVTKAGTMADSYLTNVKLVDDAGQQIGTVQSSWSGASVSSTNLNYVIPANTTRVVSVIADVNSSATGTVQMGIASIAGQGYTSLAAVSNSGQTGNSLSSNSSILTVTANGALGSVSGVSGQSGIKVASFALTAGPATAVTFSNLTLKTATLGNKFQNMVVKVGSTQLGQAQSNLADNTSYNFTAGSPISIAAGGQVIVDVYADSLSNTTFGPAKVVDFTGLSAIAVSTNQAITNVPAAPQAGQNVTIGAGGSLSYAGFSMPQGAQVGMAPAGGTNSVKLATYKVTGSTQENMTLKDVTLTVNASNTVLMSNFRLMVGSTQYPASGQSLTGSSLTFYGVNIPVPQNQNPTIDVMADVNSWAAIQPSGVHTASNYGSLAASISSINFQGDASQNTGTATSSDTGNVFAVLRTTLTPSTGSGSLAGGISDANPVGFFTFQAGAGDDAYVKTMTLTHVFSGATVSTSTPVKVYDGSTLVGQGILGTTSGSSATVTLNLGSADPNGVGVQKGTSKTLQVKADMGTAGFLRAVSGSAMSYQMKLSNWTWSDGTVTSIGADASIPNQPILGSASSLQL